MNIDFIKEKWSSKYIFDEKFKYINDETDVILKCPIHGYFKINPKMLEYSDVNEDLCRKCYRELHKNIKYTQEEFLEIANKYYGDKYVFDDKCVYINQYHNVTIYCKKHKEYFETYPSSIINHNVKHLCHKCNEEEGFVYKYDKEKYIKKCKELYPNSTIIYDDIVFNTLREYITVKCPIHGEFVINAYYNLYYGCECPKCKEERKNKELLKDFVNKLIIAQPNIDSSKVSGPYFKDGMKHTKENAYYEIWCEEHGYQRATSKYLLKNGCPRCEKKGSIVHRDYTNEEFINEIHKCYGDLYDTSLVEYVNWKTKVKLICPIHGEFYREPFRLIKEKRGCPYCNTIFLLEVEIEDYLKKYNIQYIHNYRTKWLGKKSLDFYLIDFNVGIECQGRQHFCKDSIYNNGKSIEEIIAYDKIKYDLCKKHNIRIFYYSKYIINDYIDVMYTSKEELFKNIKNIKNE